jgi:hypothetical protein
MKNDININKFNKLLRVLCGYVLHSRIKQRNEYLKLRVFIQK